MKTRYRRILAHTAFGISLCLASSWGAMAAAGEGANCQTPLFSGLGKQSFAITTASKEARQYFHQGLALAYGFNHAEAERSFRKALSFDSRCAMCYWGVALVLGPNINAPMAESAAKPAFDALQKALALSSSVTPREQAYIKALEKRYSAEATPQRSHLDLAYGQAMAEVAAQFPRDKDAWALYAEALMDTTPWDYWEANDQPKKVTVEILAALERALKLDPNHVGANHLYIHTVEASKPQWGEQAADRLRQLAPRAGHIVHMPSHIYIRIGRYHDAVLANHAAIAADQLYLKGCHAEGFYLMMYIPHNYDFLTAAAYLSGDASTARKTAAELRDYILPHLIHMPEMADSQQFWAAPYFTMLRFELWQDLLKEEEPSKSWPHAHLLWRYGQTVANAREGKLDAAATQLAELEKEAAAPWLQTAMLMGVNSASAVAAIAVEEARGELAAARGHDSSAIEHFERAVALQDKLRYMEPPPWYHSIRLSLGKMLLKTGQATAAEKTFLEDLRKFPENGWALEGLYRSLQAQERLVEAQAVKVRLDRAWRFASPRRPDN